MLRGIGEAKFLFQHLGIHMADSERDQRGHIAEHRLSSRKGELFDVLMGERQAESIFTSFREDRREGVGGEVLELVDKQVEIITVLFGLTHALHGSDLELGSEQAPEQTGFVMAQGPLGKVGDKDALVIENKREADPVADLTEDIARCKFVAPF